MFTKKKKLVLLLFIISTTTILLSANVSAKKKTLYVKSTHAKMRVLPCKLSKQVKHLKRGAKLKITRDCGTWVRVEDNNEVTGFVWKKYLSKKDIKKNYRTISSPNGRYKSYMDYRCITSTGSPQYKLQRKAHTDNKTGIRMVNDRYCVALGSGFCSKIGTKVDIIMKSGKTIKAILADQKKNSETIYGHKAHSWDGSVIEAIVQTSALPHIAKIMGDVSYCSKYFKGGIKCIKVYK